MSTASQTAPTTRHRIGLLIGVAILLMSVSLLLTGEKGDETILITFPNDLKLECEVASTPEKLLVGLSFHEPLLPGKAMLSIFESSGRLRQWTKAYRAPVDLIWVDESKRIVHIMERVPPCETDPCPRHGPPPSDARYIVQTTAGLVAQQSITLGMELKFTLVM